MAAEIPTAELSTRCWWLHAAAIAHLLRTRDKLYGEKKTDVMTNKMHDKMENGERKTERQTQAIASNRFVVGRLARENERWRELPFTMCDAQSVQRV